jgi:hypothetical protein
MMKGILLVVWAVVTLWLVIDRFETSQKRKAKKEGK